MSEPHGSRSKQSGDKRKDRIVPKPDHASRRTTGTQENKSRGSHQPQQTSRHTKTTPSEPAQPSPEALLADQVEATKGLLNWAIGDLANTIRTFEQIQGTLRKEESKWDKELQEAAIFGPVNLSKKHWNFHEIIEQYKATVKTEIEYWEKATKEAKAKEKEWESELRFLSGKELIESMKLRAAATGTPSTWSQVWTKGTQQAPWHRYEQINSKILGYYEETWEGEDLSSDKHSRELKTKLDAYYKRSQGTDELKAWHDL